VGIFQQQHAVEGELKATFGHEGGTGWTRGNVLRLGGPLSQRFMVVICQGQQDNSLSIE